MGQGGEAGAELRARLVRLRARPEERRPLELGPASAYEALTRQMVERLEEDLAAIKGRLDGLLWMVAGAIVVDVVARVATAGL